MPMVTAAARCLPQMLTEPASSLPLAEELCTGIFCPSRRLSGLASCAGPTQSILPGNGDRGE
jgi:predicted nucleic acid binding AN1-type Zn finger protein